MLIGTLGGGLLGQLSLAIPYSSAPDCWWASSW